MNGKDLLAIFAIREVNSHAAVEATGAQERGVEHVGSVGRGHNDDLLMRLETVHLDQDLIECLLALVVAATHTATTHAADRVDLVDENNRRCGLLRELEEVAHTARAHTDKHLDELRTADREEWYACLACHCAREQGLSRPGCTHEDNALRDACADIEKLLRVLEEIDNLEQFLFRLFGTRHVSEGNAL